MAKIGILGSDLGIGLALAMAAQAKDSILLVTLEEENLKQESYISFPIAERTIIEPYLDYSRYDKDIPNYRKHKETCAKNRQKRKAKKRK